MIDFHAHILPGIDDGSKDILETKELLKMEYQQGVRQVLATPHFYANHESISHFLEKREESKRQLEALVQTDTRLPELRMAAEVYYFPGMGKAEMLSRLCMEDSSLILIELPFAQWTGGMYEDVKNIMEKQHLTVVLAHVERYVEFQKDNSIWDAMMKLPLYPQINAGSLIGRGKKRRFDLKFIRSGTSFVLGTDCHNMVSRPPNMEGGRAVIARKLGDGYLEKIDALGRELWDHA